MQSNNLLEHVYLCLRKYMWVWLAPMILGLVLSGVYNKLLATKTYTARQSLILRDDLLGDSYKPSRFDSEESLKSAQETILEIARKPQVVKAVLDQLGPASSFFFSGDYPSVETIEDVQGNITLSAPNGAEFGKTEAVVLSVKTVDADRSRKFVNLLLDEIDSKLSEVRLLRLNSMQSELSQAGENAMLSLNDSSQRLQELEKSFGAEITTIRALNDPQAGGGFDLKLNQIRLEQRQAAAQLSSAKQQRELLRQAQENEGAEFVTSNELLQLQPALQGIMTNLSAAMAQLAIDEGRYTGLHPQLRRSQRAVKQQKQQLFDSIGTTAKGLDSQIETLSALKERLGNSIVQLESKLEALTEQRVPYATLEEEVKKKTEVYNDVQGQLAQVQSYASSTNDVAMLTRVDDPQVSSRPDQIGAFKAGLVGAAIGLMLGLGLVALLAPPFIDPRASYSPSVPSFSDGVAVAAPEPSPVPSPQPQPQPQPVATPPETHVESRLKSVAAKPRTTTDSLSSKLDQSEGAEDGVGIAREPADSAVPDSIAQHMAEMKQRVKEGKSARSGKSVTPASAPPSDAPVVEAEAPSTDSAGVTRAETHTINLGNTNESPDVSSEDVIAELKKLQSETGQTLAEEVSPKTGAKDQVVVQRRPTLSSFAAGVSAVPKAAESAKPSPQAPVDSVEKPEIVAVDRIRSPEVPESITKGRITAESLLKSREENKGSQDQTFQADSSVQEKVASLASEPLPTPTPEGGIEPTGDKSLDARIPSIADYARSLDRKLGSTEGDRIADSIDNAAAGATSPTPRASNVRPLDIARSLEDPSLQRPPVENVQPHENSVNSIASESRPESISDFVGTMSGSVAGLVRGAKGTDVDQTTVRPTEDSVAPAEKTAAKPAAATPVPRDESSSSSIPSQIRELSGSFSSFARPRDTE